MKVNAKFQSPEYLSKKSVQEFIDRTIILSGWKIRYHEEDNANWVSIGFPFTIHDHAEFCQWLDRWDVNPLKGMEVNGYYCDGCESIFAIDPKIGETWLGIRNCPYCDVALTRCEKVDDDG